MYNFESYFSILQNKELLIIIILILLTFFSLKVSIPYLNKYFIDKPNSRSSHKKPTARGGGIIFVAYGSLFCFIENLFLPLFCLPLAFVGILDDRFDLPLKIRFISHLLTIFVLLSF